MKKCAVFKYKGRFAHFLRAEANASAPSYPFPSRTVLLGLVGAVMGMEKDSSQVVLKNANFSVSGKAELTHWHTANLRKDTPAALPLNIKKSDKGSTGKIPRNTQIAQEWLINPNYTIWTSLPDPHQNEFEQRIKERRWYFNPCLGLSEMGASLEFIGTYDVRELDEGKYEVQSVMRESQVSLDWDDILSKEFALKKIRLPRDVSPIREFSHETYYYEINNRSIKVQTSNAINVNNQTILWM